MNRWIEARNRVFRAARLAAGAVPALLLAGAVGCVSSGKYEKLAKERDALAQRLADAENERQTLESAGRDLEENLTKQQDEFSSMRGTYDALLAELEQEVAAGQIQIQRLRDGIRVNLSQDILFATGSAELDAQGRDVLTRVSEQLAKAGHRVEVEGHTDDVKIGGALARTYPSNWELAGARAARVVRLFEEKGLDRDRMAAVSFGEMRPVASNADAEGRSKNRRIEIRLLPHEGATLPAALDDAATAP
jgi:chemotaxis protein MotB